MKKMKKLIAGILFGIKAKTAGRQDAFCNIADGTHAGSITMKAVQNFGYSNLVAKLYANGEIKVANATDKPFGVCTDEADAEDSVAVALPGCAESTFMCRAANEITAGSTVYTAAQGKVSSVAAGGSYRIGVAIADASANGIVEVDPVGFGEPAWAVVNAEITGWTNATSALSLSAPYIKNTDIVIATVQTAGGSENTVKATAGNCTVAFTLDANGVSGSTKISWIAIRKN